MPFIPIFKLEKHDILNLVKNTNNINYVKSKIKFYTFSKFGHADIINYPYRDLMHYSRIAKGYNKRNNENIEKYYDTIIKIIYYFLLDNLCDATHYLNYPLYYHLRLETFILLLTYTFI